MQEATDRFFHPQGCTGLPGEEVGERGTGYLLSFLTRNCSRFFPTASSVMSHFGE
jgi:hypothetical protein